MLSSTPGSERKTARLVTSPLGLTTRLFTLALVALGCGDDGPGAGAGAGGETGAAALLPDTVVVLAYNIHHGEGMDGVLDLERIAAIIRNVDPDVVALQEVDSVVERTDGVDQAAELGRLTGLTPVFGRFMPYQGGAYGMALLSKLPIARFDNVRLPDGAEPRSSVVAEVTTPRGRALRIAGVHFYRTEEERMAQATTLDRALTDSPVPTVLAGDFNSTPESAVMSLLRASWRVVEKGEDHLTFPSTGPGREIDFVLLRPAERFEVIGERLITEPVASDHRPVVTELVIR